MSLSPATSRLRRSANSLTISLTGSCDDCSAVTAAICPNAAVQETLFVTSRVTGSTSGSGKTP